MSKKFTEFIGLRVTEKQKKHIDNQNNRSKWLRNAIQEKITSEGKKKVSKK